MSCLLPHQPLSTIVVLCASLLLQNSESLIATSLIHGDAVWDRVALEADELSFTVGDEVEILDMSDDVWWYGNVRDSLGWFPASFIRVICNIYI